MPLLAGWTTKAKRVVHLHGTVSDEGSAQSMGRVIRVSDAAVAVSHAVAAEAGGPCTVIHGFATARERQRRLGGRRGLRCSVWPAGFPQSRVLIMRFEPLRWYTESRRASDWRSPEVALTPKPWRRRPGLSE